MFLDTTNIYVQSGKGGNGMVHMHREKYKPRGGPDGGDGGRGGSVIFEVIPTLNTLTKFHYNQRFIAEEGKPGGPNNRSGKSAPNLVIQVPPGTIVINAETEEVLVTWLKQVSNYWSPRAAGVDVVTSTLLPPVTRPR